MNVVEHLTQNLRNGFADFLKSVVRVVIPWQCLSLTQARDNGSEYRGTVMIRHIPKVALLLGALAIAGQAEAHGGGGPGWGGAAVIGAVVGGVVGAAVASGPAYAAPAPVYVAPAPVYVAPAPVYYAPPPPPPPVYYQPAVVYGPGYYGPPRGYYGHPHGYYGGPGRY
jgi:hypothetical protein